MDVKRGSAGLVQIREELVGGLAPAIVISRLETNYSIN